MCKWSNRSKLFLRGVVQRRAHRAYASFSVGWQWGSSGAEKARGDERLAGEKVAAPPAWSKFISADGRL